MRRGAGPPDAGRDGLAAGAGRAPSLHPRRRGLGRPAGAGRARTSSRAMAANPRLVGVRHIVQDEPDDRFLLRPDFLRGVAALAERDLAYDILDPSAAPAGRASSSCGAFPRSASCSTTWPSRPSRRGALGRLGTRPARAGRMRERVREAVGPRHRSRLERVDARTRSAPYLDVAFECFGPSRLLIGSDWPVCTRGRGLRARDGRRDGLPAGRPIAEQEAVLGGNAARFWKLERGRQTRDLRSTSDEHRGWGVWRCVAVIGAGVACGGGDKGAPPAAARAHDRGHPQGHDARVLEEHPRGRREGRARSWASTSIWRGPLREDDRDEQITEVEQFVSRGVVGHRAGAARRQRAGGAGVERDERRRSRS